MADYSPDACPLSRSTRGGICSLVHRGKWTLQTPVVVRQGSSDYESTAMIDLIQLTDRGLYCPQGEFFIDPWLPVTRAIITHAHSDHARWGSERYLTSASGREVLRARLGSEAVIDSLEYGEKITHNGVRISLHPAGHVLGSAQVRVEYRDQICVISGDYKLDEDPTCQRFDPVRCQTFLTESTFGLPIYRWDNPAQTFRAINQWWKTNQEVGKASLLLGYSLGKAQRLLAGIDATLGPIYTHGAITRMNETYRSSGVDLPPTLHAADLPRNTDFSRALILAPPSAHNSSWARKFGPSSTAMASGWMRVRGPRRRRALDRGFVLSDHADWPGLLQAIQATQAERVLVTHGHVAILVRYLREQGLDAEPLQTRFEGEIDDASEVVTIEP